MHITPLLHFGGNERQREATAGNGRIGATVAEVAGGTEDFTNRREATAGNGRQREATGGNPGRQREATAGNGRQREATAGNPGGPGTP